MKLYYSPGACSLAAHITSEEKNLGLELEKVDLKAHKTEKGEDFTAINPKGYVPALRLNDGSLLTENVAILLFLADQAPASGFTPVAPAMARYRLLEWLAYITSELHKSFGPIFHGAAEDVKKQARAQITKRLAYADTQLVGKPFLMGEQFTVADAYLFVMLRWCEASKVDLSPFANITAFKSRITARPKVQAALKAEGLPT